MGYIYKTKCIAQRLPNIEDDELLDQFIRGLHPSILKLALKEDPNTFEKMFYFAERCLHLDALAPNLHQSQQIQWDSGGRDFQKDYVSIDLDLMRARQANFHHIKIKIIKQWIL